MTSELSNYGQGRAFRFLRNRTETMLRLIQQNAPAAMIAKQAVLIHQSAWVACGPDMGDAMAATMISACRQSHGFCQHCYSEVAPERTHPPICEQCDARRQSEYEEHDNATPET